MLANVVAGLDQVPRHRSIHVGGFVLTEEPLSTVVPVEPASMANRTVIQWEKDDLDFARLVKIDLLGLGMLTVLQDCLTYVRATRGVTLDLRSGTAAPFDSRGRFRSHRGTAVYRRACRARVHGEPDRYPVGEGRPRLRAPREDRPAGTRHAHGAAGLPDVCSCNTRRYAGPCHARHDGPVGVR